MEAICKAALLTRLDEIKRLEGKMTKEEIKLKTRRSYNGK